MGVNTWPVEGGWRVTSTIGPRSSPGGNASTYHRGLDIAPPVAGTIGQGIVAAGGGTVTRVGTDYRNVKQGGSGYGGFVEIKHSDGTMTRYGHMSNVSVRPGDRVGEGDSIGRMGNSGESYGSHLHFERLGKDGQKKSQMFDNDELNKRASKRGKGDGDDPKKDKDQEKKDKEDEGKEGKGEGNKDTKDSNKSRDKEEKPPKPKDKPDIQGETNNYRETTMKTIASRLPTHEPWIGHPKSTEGPRQGVQESGSQNNGGGTGNAQSGGGSGSGGSGGGSGNGGGGSGGGSSGTSTNPGGSGSGNDNIPTGNAGAGGSFNQGQWDKSQYVYDEYRKAGYSHEVASAAVGNAMWESRMNNNNNTGDGGKAHGIFQWNDRAPALKRYAAAQGKDWTDFKTQVSFSLAELDGSAKKYGSNETRAGNLLRNQNLSQDEATHLFANTYERPAGSNARNPMGGNPHGNENRKKLAREFSSKIKGRKPKTADPGANEKAQDSAPKPAETAKPTSGTSAAPAASADGLNS